MKTLKYVFPSTGHCGSKYVANLLTSAGVPCGHEKTFRTGVSTHYVETDVFVAESSAFAAPYLGHPICKGAQIVHVVRHPLRVMRSWMYGRGQWGAAARPFFVECLQSHGDLWLLDTPMDSGATDDRHPNWLAAFYVAWNLLIERTSEGRSRIAHVEAGPAILDMIGVRRPDDMFDDRECNKHSQKKEELTWDCIPDSRIRDELQLACARYGYPEVPE